MNPEQLRQLLENIINGKIGVDHAYHELKNMPFKSLGHTRVDNHRELRNGYPEVIFCQGKSAEQVITIIETMYENGCNILATRANPEIQDVVQKTFLQAEISKAAGLIMIKQKEYQQSDSYVAVITAGTSDIPVAEEAALTSEFYGSKVERIFDIGVAGIHRIQENLDDITKARVIIVAAGMEGALPSVIGGLVDKPLIALPTSIGYGASFNGLAALLGMLNTCASGVCVVNIDNGFGAGYLANMINKL